MKPFRPDYTTIVLPKPLRDRLKHHAIDRGQSMIDLLAEIVERALNAQDRAAARRPNGDLVHASSPE